tara:strand:- start:112 stop:312 length:201 start_codon:yes stop_codon:yes gene_type:complete
MTIKIEKITLITAIDTYGGINDEGISAIDEIIKQISKSKDVTIIEYHNPIEMQLKEKHENYGIPKV